MPQNPQYMTLLHMLIAEELVNPVKGKLEAMTKISHDEQRPANKHQRNKHYDDILHELWIEVRHE